MNFSHMPELRWPAAYPIVVALMVIAGLVLYTSFKRAHWL
jgi:magnesium transporter